MFACVLRWAGRRRWAFGARAPCKSDEDGRLGRVRRASLTNMDAWGAFPALRWREMPVVARRMCHNREFFVAYGPYWGDMARHTRHKRKSSSAAPSACATNASLRQLFPPHVPQVDFSVSCSFYACHERSSLSPLYAINQVPASWPRCMRPTYRSGHSTCSLQPRKTLRGRDGRRHHPVRQIHREEMSS